MFSKLEALMNITNHGRYNPLYGRLFFIRPLRPHAFISRKSSGGLETIRVKRGIRPPEENSSESDFGYGTWDRPETVQKRSVE
jgi:hypothetical protein